MLVCVSSCWAPSEELRKRAPRWTALIPDVRSRQVKGDEGWDPQPPTPMSPQPKSLLDQWPPPPSLPKTTPWPLAVPLRPTGPRKGYSSLLPTPLLPSLHFCLTFFNLCHSLSRCHSPSPSLSLRLNGGVSSKGCQAELLAGHDVPEALKWGVDLRGVKPVFYAATQPGPEI